jgi:galactoside O-acetyltransferase
MPLLTQEEISNMGFRHVGKNVRLSTKASFYNPQNISIGDYSRIDDFCVLSAGEGGIQIGRNVHIAVYVSIVGKGKILIDDFAGISSRVSIYSSNDDYSGEFLTGPTVNEKFTHVHHADVLIRKHALVGSGSIILPQVVIEEGAVIGALSLVKGNCEPFGIYTGVPAKLINKRSRKVLQLETEFIQFQESRK